MKEEGKREERGKDNKEVVLTAPVSIFHTSRRNVVSSHGGFCSSSRQAKQFKDSSRKQSKNVSALPS